MLPPWEMGDQHAIPWRFKRASNYVGAPTRAILATNPSTLLTKHPNTERETIMAILTLKQYLTEHENDLIAKYGCSRKEAHSITIDWRDYVVRSFAAGEDVPLRLWRTLDDSLQYRVFRTSRALRDDNLTHTLRAPLKQS